MASVLDMRLFMKFKTPMHMLDDIIIPLTIGFKKSTLESYTAVVSYCSPAAEVDSYVQTLFFPPSHLKINL